MKAKEVLETAAQLVSTDRAEDYGEMRANMQNTADLWNAYLRGRSEVTASDVAVMMCLLKVSRISGGKAKADNYIDLAGYAAIAAQVSE